MASSFASFRPVSNLHYLLVLQTYPNRDHEITPSDLHSSLILNAICVRLQVLQPGAVTKYICLAAKAVYLKLAQPGSRTDTVTGNRTSPVQQHFLRLRLHTFARFVLVVITTNVIIRCGVTGVCARPPTSTHRQLHLSTSPAEHEPTDVNSLSQPKSSVDITTLTHRFFPITTVANIAALAGASRSNSKTPNNSLVS